MVDFINNIIAFIYLESKIKPMCLNSIIIAKIDLIIIIIIFNIIIK
jgi:hypothetical protein